MKSIEGVYVDGKPVKFRFVGGEVYVPARSVALKAWKPGDSVEVNYIRCTKAAAEALIAKAEGKAPPCRNCGCSPCAPTCVVADPVGTPR